MMKTKSRLAAALHMLLLVASPGLANAGVGGWVADKATGMVTDRAVEAVKSMLPAAPAPVALPRTNGFAGCASHFPKGLPLDASKVDRAWKPRALCASHFAVLHSGISKTPLLVVERLTRDRLADALDEQRSEVFFSDDRLPPAERAELSDYTGSGYDRGHNAPAADMPDATAMAQSFVLSNIVPQDPEHNRKVWSKVESDTRKYVRRATGNVFVFTGPLFTGERRTIGAGKVWVPSHLFKLVYDEGAGRSWAFVIPNTPTARVGQPMDYAGFVKMTGWTVLGAPGSAGLAH